VVGGTKAFIAASKSIERNIIYQNNNFVYRYTGGKLSDDITGQQITYNNLTDVFTVDSQTPQAGNQPGSSSGGRVRAVLAPKAPPSASPAGTPAAGARLQATPQLTAPQEP
jgi:lipopolysaccharide export system protein LptA